MERKVAEEGEKAEELHNKFMCYCKTSGSELSKSITTAEAKIAELKAKTAASGDAGEQLKGTLKQARADRTAAKATMKEGKAIREKEAAAYAAEKGDCDGNIAAILAAIAAIEKGMAGPPPAATTASSAVSSSVTISRVSSSSSSSISYSSSSSSVRSSSSSSVSGFLQTGVAQAL